jgi:hypothetical protein
LEELIKLKHENQKSDFWIGGDFSLPDMNWSSLTVTAEVAANPEIRFLVFMLQLDKFFQGSILGRL